MTYHKVHVLVGAADVDADEKRVLPPSSHLSEVLLYLPRKMTRCRIQLCPENKNFTRSLVLTYTKDISIKLRDSALNGQVMLRTYFSVSMK